MHKTVKRLVSIALAAVLGIWAWMPSGSQPVHAVDYVGSESYMSGKYYQALKQIKLTGDARTDIVNVALSQVGYLEGTYFDELSGEICGNLNATEYGDWYQMQDQWCAIFMSWCAAVSGVSEDVMPKHSYTPIGLQWFRSKGRAYTRARVAAGAYTPQPGDLIYFKSGSTTNPTNHVGLVTDYRDGVVYTVEGNTSSPSVFSSGGAVAAKSYAITNTYIVYICSPDYELTGFRVADDPQMQTVEAKIAALRRAISILETGTQDNYGMIGQSYDGRVTIGCGQWYAEEAKQLLLGIQQEDPEAFEQLDTAGIAQMLLEADWQNYRIDPETDEARCIAAILASDAGIRTQNVWMAKELLGYQAEAGQQGVADVDAQLACAALRYMGGTAAVRQVLDSLQGECTAETVCDAMNAMGFVGADLIRDALN